MSTPIKSGASTDQLTIDAFKAAYMRPRDGNGNDLAKSPLEQLTDTEQALLMSGKADGIAVPKRVDRSGNQIFGNYIPELIENFEGATVNVQKWTQTSTTFVPAQATLTGYSFNSTSLTTVSAVSVLSSQRLFSKFARRPMQIRQRMRHSMVSGSIGDFGFGIPTSTTLIVPNGVQVRFTNSGQVQLVMTINSVEIAITNVLATVTENGNTIGQPLNMSNAAYTSNYFVYDLIVDDEVAQVQIKDSDTGKLIGYVALAVPVSQYKMWGATAVPMYNRCYNSVAPSTAPIFIVTDIIALGMDMAINMHASQIAGNLSLSAGRQPFTGAQNENHTNSAAPASATLSNTAAGYTTLGGKFRFAAVAGSETDYALFAFTVPAGSRFICEGVSIFTVNTGAAVGATATILEWAMGFNSSAVSLATANIVLRQCGIQNLPAASAIGFLATLLNITFDTPEVVESARFVHVILKMPVGLATASQVIRGQVLIRGRFI